MMQNFMAKEKGKIVLTSTIEEYYIFCDYMQIGSLRNVHLWLFSTFDPTALACFFIQVPSIPTLKRGGWHWFGKQKTLTLVDAIFG